MGSQLLTAAEVAEMLAVSRGWVYDHADDLGAVRLGSGRRPRLRFDAQGVLSALTSRSAGRGSGASKPPAPPGSDGRPRHRRSGTDTQLLPIRGVSRHSRGQN